VLGFRQALAAHGSSPDDALIRSGAVREAGGYRAMQELLASSPRPTAVFAANDLLAMGALVAIREAGLSVPRDLAVIGFDDIPTARLVWPPLTTIAQFPADLGRRAAEMLLERLHGTAPPLGRAEELPYRLVVRGSV
jgi:LacI family transcriptional regulator